MTIHVTRQLIAEIRALLKKREPPPYQSVLKYDRNQPRGPKGSATGGQWVKGVSAGESGATHIDVQPGAYGKLPTWNPKPEAGYATMMRAPTGTGFKNTPRGVNLPEPPLKTAPSMPSTPALIEGSVSSVRKKFSGGVNASYLLEMDDEAGTRAVYKPEQGEMWSDSGFTNSDISDYITNKNFSLAEREAIASEVSVGLGFGELVPETHLRETLHVEGIDYASDEDGGGYDEDYAREQYDEYKEKAREKAYDEVSEEMGQLYQDAKVGHADAIKDRAEELNEIWNEEIKGYPDDSQYGSGSALAEHPNLPLGSKEPFERKDDQGVLDPLEVMDEAGVDYEYALNTTEKNKIREIIRKRLEEGYSELGDVDEDAAKEHLDYDKFIEDHADTEGKLLESKIQTFTEWRHSQGYRSGSGGGGGGAQNPDAPHPNGGSLQKFVAGLNDWGSMSHEDATKMAVLDYVIGTMDRHGGNMKYLGDTPVAIDNGYSMPGSDEPDNFYFRSVAVAEWMGDARHHEVPEATRNTILASMNQIDWQALADRHPNMSRKEREAFLGRVVNMKEALSYDEGLSTLWHDQRLMRG